MCEYKSHEPTGLIPIGVVGEVSWVEIRVAVVLRQLEQPWFRHPKEIADEVQRRKLPVDDFPLSIAQICLTTPVMPHWSIADGGETRSTSSRKADLAVRLLKLRSMRKAGAGLRQARLQRPMQKPEI